MSHTFADFLIRILREICWYVLLPIVARFLKDSQRILTIKADELTYRDS